MSWLTPPTCWHKASSSLHSTLVSPELFFGTPGVSEPPHKLLKRLRDPPYSYPGKFKFGVFKAPKTKRCQKCLLRHPHLTPSRVTPGYCRHAKEYRKAQASGQVQGTSLYGGVGSSRLWAKIFHVPTEPHNHRRWPLSPSSSPQDLLAGGRRLTEPCAEHLSFQLLSM